MGSLTDFVWGGSRGCSLMCVSWLRNYFCEEHTPSDAPLNSRVLFLEHYKNYCAAEPFVIGGYNLPRAGLGRGISNRVFVGLLIRVPMISLCHCPKQNLPILFR